MTRTLPQTNWTRDRYTFGIVDVNGAVLVDIDGNYVNGVTDTNPISTIWS